jgi:hypothetical protein
MTSSVDLILLRSKVNDSSDVSEIAKALKELKQNEFRQIIISYSRENQLLYGYFYLDSPAPIKPIDRNNFLANLANVLDEVEISRIAFVNTIDGFSAGQAPNRRYVVEMDPEVGWKDELFSWYDKEHLPGLAAVPGCIKATRCINLDHLPLSFAFYDLESSDVLGCVAWLKVRHTLWSDKVRPHFTNTRRTMFTFVR